MSDDIDEDRIDSISERFRYLLDALKEDYIKTDEDKVVVATVLAYDGLLGCSYFMSREELHQVVDEILDTVGDAEEKDDPMFDLKDSTLH